MIRVRLKGFGILGFRFDGMGDGGMISAGMRLDGIRCSTVDNEGGG